MFAPIVVLSALASLFMVRAVSVPACARTYTVAQGDRCNTIAIANGVSTYQLAHANPTLINADCSNLVPGETLCLGYVGQDCTKLHGVVKDEYCYQIAQNAGIELATLFANNPNVDKSTAIIYPGEVLCIASEVIPYT